MRRLRAAFAWNRAYDLSLRGRHQEALVALRSVDVDAAMRWHWNIFVILQLSLLGRHEEVLDAVSRYIEDFQGPSSADRIYMLEFAKWCARSAFRERFPAEDVPGLFGEAFRTLDLQKVSPRWKRTFQLIAHPNWGR